MTTWSGQLEFINLLAESEGGLAGAKLRGNQPGFAQVRYSAADFAPLVPSEAWWARQDSNLRPDRYERSALTT
jgi:hypothetical protein